MVIKKMTLVAGSLCFVVAMLMLNSGRSKSKKSAPRSEVTTGIANTTAIQATSMQIPLETSSVPASLAATARPDDNGRRIHDPTSELTVGAATATDTAVPTTTGGEIPTTGTPTQEATRPAVPADTRSNAQEATRAEEIPPPSMKPENRSEDRNPGGTKALGNRFHFSFSTLRSQERVFRFNETLVERQQEARSRSPAFVPASSQLPTDWVERYLSAGASRPHLTNRSRSVTPDKCSNNSDCHVFNGCIATPVGVCYQAPFDMSGGVVYQPQAQVKVQVKRMNGHGPPRGFASGGFQGTELTCSWQPEQPSTLPNFDLNDEGPENLVQLFKHFTGSFFQKWYDWDAPIKRLPPLGTTTAGQDRAPFNLFGGHTGTQKLFQYENVCIIPGTSELAGFNSTFISQYKGGNEYVSAGGIQWYQRILDTFNDFLTRNVTQLQSEPMWYVDRKLVIVPIAGENDWHPGNLLHKTGAIVFGADDAFRRDTTAGAGLGAREDVTTLYVPLSHPRLGSFERCGADGCVFQDSVHSLYTTLATTTHASLAGRRGADLYLNRTHAGETFLRRHPRAEAMQKLQALLRKPICFREAVVIQSCYLKDCLAMPKVSNFDSWKRRHVHMWPYWGYRHPSVQDKIARRLRAS